MGDAENLPKEQQILFNLLLKANKKQTEDINAKIDTSISLLKTSVDATNQEVDSLKKRCINLERRIRQNNIIVFGAISLFTSQSLASDTILLLNNLLGVTLKTDDINNVYKIGKSENPPIIVEFVSFLKKKTLFENKDKLKELKQHGISITNDQSIEDRNNFKILRKHLKNAREQNLNAKIRGQKLLVEDEIYSIEDLDQLEKRSEKIGQKNDKNELSSEDDIDHNLNNIDKGDIATKSKEGSHMAERVTSQNKNKRKAKYSPKFTRSTKK